MQLLPLVRILALPWYFSRLTGELYFELTRSERLWQFFKVTVTVAMLAYLAGTTLYIVAPDYPFDPSQQHSSGWDHLLDRIWWSFRQLESADNLVPNVHNPGPVTLISLLLTILGVFIISFIIGIGSSVVEHLVRAERRRPLRLQGHTLVVGPLQHQAVVVGEFVKLKEKNHRDWLQQLRALAASARDLKRSRSGEGPIRMAMLGQSAEIPDFLYEGGMRRVAYRQGDATDVRSLERAAAADAKRLILMAEPELGADADALSIAALAAFRSLNRDAQVFVEVQDSHNLELFHSVGEAFTQPLDVSRVLGLFLCPHLVTPGVELLFRDLLTAHGSELYTLLFLPHTTPALPRHTGDQLNFAALAQAAYERHHVLLVGAWLGDEPVRRGPFERISADGLELVLNPLANHQKTLPVARVRGFLGIAEAFLPFREAFLALQHSAPTAPYTPPASPFSGPGFPAEKQGASDEGLPKDTLDSACGPRRLLVVGDSAGLPTLLDELARYRSGLEVLLVVDENAWKRSPLRRVVGSRVVELNGVGHAVLMPLEQGGRLQVVVGEGAELASASVDAVRRFGVIEAAVFLSELDAVDRDARTAVRILRFARALEASEVPRGSSLHMLAEFVSLERGERIKAHVTAHRCGFPGQGSFRLTLVSTQQIKNYFMVHSAFVPGVSRVYQALLGAGGQELVRFPLSLSMPGQLGLADFFAPFWARGALPVALELRGGEVLLNPPPHARFAAEAIAAVHLIARRDAAGAAVSHGARP
jgi:hypothetical protein